MTGLDGQVLSRFLELAGERLRGNWVVLDGCVLPLRGVEHRVTVDIDLAGPDEAGMDQTLALMDLAEELGLPVEAINQAGAFFLRKITGWDRHLVEVHRGPTAVLHVPDATLFLLLKVGRLSEADLLDCLAMVDLARREDEALDEDRVAGVIRDALGTEASPGRRERLESLLRVVRGED